MEATILKTGAHRKDTTAVHREVLRGVSTGPTATYNHTEESGKILMSTFETNYCNKCSSI